MEVREKQGKIHPGIKAYIEEKLKTSIPINSENLNLANKKINQVAENIFNEINVPGKAIPQCGGAISIILAQGTAP